MLIILVFPSHVQAHGSVCWWYPFPPGVGLTVMPPGLPHRGWTSFTATLLFLALQLMKTVENTILHMAVCQNLVPLVNIKIAGKWMFIPLKMVLIGIDP